MAGGADRSSVPPRVKLPEVVTVPVRVRPLTVPVPETLVTVPEPPPVELSVPPANDNPEPIVTALKAPALPYRMPEVEVNNVIAGVVVEVATEPLKPFAETTETFVTVPVPPTESQEVLVPSVLSTLPLFPP
jgi:hypothetical protein